MAVDDVSEPCKTNFLLELPHVVTVIYLYYL